MAWKHTTYHNNNSHSGHKRLKEQLEKNNFGLSVQKHWQEGEEEIER